MTSVFRDWNNPLGHAAGLLSLACAALYCDDVAEARSSLRESIRICAELRYGTLSAACLRACAAILARTNEPRDAACFLGASQKLLEEMRSPLEVTEQRMHEETQALIRAALDDEEIAAAWDAGRVLSVDEALSRALSYLD
ncbi:MAG: hypothetical protein H0U82_12280 [Actinobacteria bacterium]|nr:hypothetical protein [Actinomycetota bacterium]